jgi:undecaprenyl diphosphate synthase
MDGNGRWARRQGLRRVEGHRAAEKSIHEAVEWCGEKGVEYLTLFAFSTENWKRPRTEVAFIMRLLSSFIRRNIDDLDGKRVRLRATGRLDRLPSAQRADLDAAIARTAANTGLQLVLAINYGGRAEIADAAREIARRALAGELDPGSIDEDSFAGFLYLPDVPDPDLVIRTSGELRISNFLLWESAYSEYLFPEVLWPDFRKKDLDEALGAYESRNRRFGGLESGDGRR